MKKVIDSNQLQSENLRSFLAKSKSNRAVLTDYAAMEAYKGDTLSSIFRSMEVLCEFPDQVIVLKSTRFVCGLHGRSKGLQKRLIDERQTREFPDFVHSLQAAKRGDKRYLKSILAHGHEASKHMEKMLQDATTTGEAIKLIAQLYSKEERAAFRKRSNYPPGTVDRIVKNIMQVAAQIFSNHPNVTRWPRYEELANTFIFRSSLCMYLLALDWAAKGGVEKVAPEKHRNDMIDMNFSTYAMYFDGLQTADTKTAILHREARNWVVALFDCKLPGGLSHCVG